MDEQRAVERRLERIDGLRAGGGARPLVLAEVRALLGEGQAWLEAERRREDTRDVRASTRPAEPGGEAEVA